MKLFLLNPPFLPLFSRSSRSPAVTKSGTIYYPLWLAHATGYLEKMGHEVKLVDACADGLERSDVLSIAMKFNPDIIVLDTSTPSIYNDVEVAAALKAQHPGSLVALVGTHPTALPEETLMLDKKVDVVCRKEYDLTLADLADKYGAGGRQSLSQVPGISFRDGDRVVHNADRPFLEDLDQIPYVSAVYKKHLNWRNYFYAHTRNPVISIFAGRGCPFKCSYCVYPQTLFGRKYRMRSAEHFVGEMQYIQDNFPDVREVLVDDDTFTVYEKKVQEICRLMVERKIRLPWTCEVRVTTSFETMRAMKEAGCRLVVVGFESGVQEILDNVNKGAKVEMAYEFFKNAEKAGLMVHGCFMVGNPGETKETMRKTLDFAKQFMMDTFQCFPVMLYPGTEMYDWAKEKGYITTTNFREWLSPEGMHNCVLQTPQVSNTELVRFCDTARREYYLQPSFLLYKLKQFVFQPEERGHIIKSAKKFFWYLFKS